MDKKNILVLTSIYPQIDDEYYSGVTPVVHYFTREWIKMGHNVSIIHNANVFPSVFYKIPGRLKTMINSKLGTVSSNINQRTELEYLNEGVKIYRLPIFKMIPKTDYTKSNINNQFDKIDGIINEMDSEPDIIVGHWENPQIPILIMLKKKYNIPVGIVFHSTSYIESRRWKMLRNDIIKNIDYIGARSKSISSKVLEVLQLKKEPFICYSGIPNEYLIPVNMKYLSTKFSEKVTEFIFVGRLIKRKNIDILIKSLMNSYPNNDFHLDIVGEGGELENLKSLVTTNNLNSNICFWKNIQRNKVVELMGKSQCFVMVSRVEAFGLVYLEAMARGLITIGSKNEGIDGVIKNNDNGFLVDAGSELSLSKLIKKLSEMTKEDKITIAEQAIETANSFSDEKVAEQYLNNLITKNCEA
jgi:glycosyltransferase involved in cell wall biosynthesis